MLGSRPDRSVTSSGNKSVEARVGLGQGGFHDLDRARGVRREPWRRGAAAVGPRAVGSVAAGLAQEWSLEPAGDPMWGYVSVVWPVRGPPARSGSSRSGRTTPATGPRVPCCGPGRAGERSRSCGTTPQTGALLLEALDPARDLESEPDVEAATEVDRWVHRRASRRCPRPRGVPRPHRRAAAHPRRVLPRRDLPVDGLTRRDFDLALDTLPVAADIDAGGPWPAVHGDLHYCNVLHTRPGAPDPGGG